MRIRLCPAFIEGTKVGEEGGENMIKKAAIAVGVFAISAAAAATMTFAQTSTPTSTPNSGTTMTPTPSGVTVPGGAPATGRGGL